MSIAFEKSETHRNLLRAFAGESQARNRYTFAAGLANKQNLQVIEQVFLFTADQARAHANVLYNYIPSTSIPRPWSTCAPPSTTNTRRGSTTMPVLPRLPWRRASPRLARPLR